jgi:hypothetical protein
MPGASLWAHSCRAGGTSPSAGRIGASRTRSDHSALPIERQYLEEATKQRGTRGMGTRVETIITLPRGFYCHEIGAGWGFGVTRVSFIYMIIMDAKRCQKSTAFASDQPRLLIRPIHRSMINGYAVHKKQNFAPRSVCTWHHALVAGGPNLYCRRGGDGASAARCY